MHSRAALEQKGGSVGHGGQFLTVTGSDNSSLGLVMLLSWAGALNRPTPGLACSPVPFLSLCSPLSPVSPFHQTEELQPKNPSWCQP